MKIKTIAGKSFDDVMAFMYALRDLGFDHEFDNGLVMRALWEALDRLWSRAGKNTGSFIRTHGEGDLLIVTFHSKVDARVFEQVKIAERGESVAVYTDVVKDKVPPRKHDLSMLGKSVDWCKAHEVLMANPRFSHYAVEGFKAMRTSAKPKDPTTPHHVKFTPTQTGMHVAFMVAGKSVLSMTLEYSYEAMAA